MLALQGQLKRRLELQYDHEFKSRDPEAYEREIEDVTYSLGIACVIGEHDIEGGGQFFGRISFFVHGKRYERAIQEIDDIFNYNLVPRPYGTAIVWEDGSWVDKSHA